ncbi:MAG TPA: PIN domain-containing protein [Tepidisphaeraceae bacterium]|nr:PIN domain-containing protein [Tepidisphaeraceae bacterium]
MIALDSDVAIDILRGIPPTVARFNSLASDETIVIPGYVAMEVIWGTRDAGDQRQTEQWLSACKIVWLEPSLCESAYRTLVSVHLKNAVSVLDLLVAQVAISMNLPLHTFNQKHFDIVPDLQTIRPYAR